jgi:hypothetical protein
MEEFKKQVVILAAYVYWKMVDFLNHLWYHATHIREQRMMRKIARKGFGRTTKFEDLSH